MSWNKIMGLLLLALTGVVLGLTGAACPGNMRISNSPDGLNNLSVNVYNGYPGPNRPGNTNTNIKTKVKANPAASNAKIVIMHPANVK